ncbi:MAG: DUF541 domain-containing protein [Phycisphaerales bacterium]|nr:MAG: DUF541 domain-containing protein [Phycisphaerales bacterium]
MKRVSPIVAPVLAWCVAGALCAVVGAGVAGAAEARPCVADRPTMHIHATGTAQAAPDTLRIGFRVVTTHETPTGALDANARSLNDARDAVERARLEDGAVTTGGLRIVAERDSRVRDGRTVMGDIVRYVVTSELHVRTSKTELAGEILQSAVRAGVNTIDWVEFTVADTDALRRAAIADAAKRAARDAATLAQASDQNLGAPRLMRVHSQDFRPMMREARAMMFDGAGEGGVAPEFSPGLVTVNVTLEVQYDISPR